MVVGLATISLRIPAAASLKEKRSHVRRLIARVQKRFNVSIAEVDRHDRWGEATIAAAIVSTEAAHARSKLDRLVRFIEEDRLELILYDYRIEIL